MASQEEINEVNKEEIRGGGPRCSCGGLLIRVWDKATGQLERYQCMGCGRRYVEGLKERDESGEVQTELLEIATFEDSRKGKDGAKRV